MTILFLWLATAGLTLWLITGCVWAFNARRIGTDRGALRRLAATAGLGLAMVALGVAGAVGG